MNNIYKIVLFLSLMIYGNASYAQTLSKGNRTTTITKTVSTEDVNLEQYENVSPMELPQAPDIKTPEIKTVVTNEKTEEDFKFSGLYTSPSSSSTMLYPDLLAIYCGLDASVVASSEKGAELHNCVNKIIRDINNSDNATKEKSLKELSRLQYEEIKLLFSTSIDEKIRNSEHVQEQKNLSGANVNTKTEMEDHVVANEAIASYIRSMADINDAYANGMRGNIFNAFNRVKASVLTEMEDEKTEEEKPIEENPNPYNVEYFDRTIIYTKENPYLSPFVWIENNMCRRNICLTPKDVEVKSEEDLSCTPQDAECPDGDYATSDSNIIMFCYNHHCSAIDKSKRDQLEGGISEIKYIQGDKCEVTRINQGNSSTKVEICPDGEYGIEGSCVRCTSGKCISITCGSEEDEHGGGEFHVDYLGNNKCLYNSIEIECPNGGPYMTQDGAACYSCQDRGCNEVNCETGDVIMKEGLYLGGCSCVIDGVSSRCQDGIYLNNKGLTESCVSGELAGPDKKIGFDKGKAVITVGAKSYSLTPEQYLDYLKTGKLAEDINWQAVEVDASNNDEPKNFIDKVENTAGKVLTWGNNVANSLLGRNKKEKTTSKDDQ